MAGPYLYLSMYGGGAHVVVWDTVAESQVAVIDTGLTSLGDECLTISKDGKKVGVRGTGGVAVIDTGTLAVTTFLTAGFGVGATKDYNVILSNDGSVMYLTRGTDSKAVAINTTTGAVITVSPAAAFNAYVGGNISPDGTRLFLGNPICSLDATTLAVQYATTFAPSYGNVCGYSADGLKAYYYDNSGKFGAFTMSSGASAGVLTQANADDFTMSPDCRTAYLLDGFYNAMNVIDVASMTQTSRVVGPTQPAFDGTAATPDGSKVYIADDAYRGLYKYDTVTTGISLVHDFTGAGIGLPLHASCRPQNADPGIWPPSGSTSILLNASAVPCGQRTATVTWVETNASDTSFNVLRNGELIAVTSGTSYTDAGPLAIPTAMVYQVQGQPSGTYSNLVSISTFACAPTGCAWTASSCPGTTWAQASSCPGTTWTAANPVPASVWTKG